MKYIISITIVTATVAVCGFTKAYGQDDAQQETEQRLLACDGETEPTLRLECFNAVVGGMKQSPITPVEEEPAVPDAAPNVPTTTAVPATTPVQVDSNFGLEDEKAQAAKTHAKQTEKQEDAETILATIVEVSPTLDGRFEVKLDNGQVWRETEATRTVRRPKAGTTVRITRGRLGSYRMKFDNDNRLASVRRRK